MMPPGWWVPIGLLITTTIAQIVHLLFSGRIARIEKAIDDINRHRSAEEDKTQVWYGDVSVRLALLEQHTGDAKKGNR